jgi:hypothetical protein
LRLIMRSQFQVSSLLLRMVVVARMKLFREVEPCKLVPA